MAKQANEEEKKTIIEEEHATSSEAEAVNQEEKAAKAAAAETDPLSEKLEEAEKNAKTQAEQIDKLTKENQDVTNRLLRTQADFDNFRKRTNKEKSDARKFRAQDIVTDMLETLDNFERALAVETASEDGAALKKGMEMVLTKLKAALKKEGVEPIESLGKPFDPNVHQAVMQEASTEHEPGIVIDVLQMGYTLNGRVLRPAMVKVSA